MGKYSKILISFACTIAFFYVYFVLNAFSVEAAPIDVDVDLVPVLDISRFAPYTLTVSSVPNEGDVSSISAEVSAINGNTVHTDCWDYFINGVCDSSPVTYNLTYNSSLSRWESSDIYPDVIYPEVFFASSSVTWYNAPLERPVFRDSYAIFRYDNPFDMVDDMSFWIEFNAIPNSSNSSDLEIYLVNNTASLSTFQSDWRHSPNIELVATYSNTATFHHTHTSNSSHHLVSLHTNNDGTIGEGNLDVTDGFWIILYSKSPKISRGWNLRYQASSLCSHPQRWYQGSQFGWTTTEQSGCPDNHIHVARRSGSMDGVHTEITVNYSSSEDGTDTQDFYYGVLPNIAPNSTSFTVPYMGGAYSGNLNIEWDPASDANDDNLLYTIDLLNNDGSFNQNITTGNSNTNVIFDTTAVVDDSYLLRGTVCDDGLPSLCTEFISDTLFYINNATSIATLNQISVNSTNSNNAYAREGSNIILNFTSDLSLDNPTVDFYSGGYTLLNGLLLQEILPNQWQAIIQIDPSDFEGVLNFDIKADNLDQIYYQTTDGSSIYVDTNAPSDPVASPSQGEYHDSVTVELTSTGASMIRYTTDGQDPTCSNGNLFSTGILLEGSITIKAIACDEAGNFSGISEFNYTVVPSSLAETGKNTLPFIVSGLVMIVFVLFVEASEHECHKGKKC